MDRCLISAVPMMSPNPTRGGVNISFNSRSRYSEYGVSGGGEPCVSESP